MESANDAARRLGAVAGTLKYRARRFGLLKDGETEMDSCFWDVCARVVPWKREAPTRGPVLLVEDVASTSIVLQARAGEVRTLRLLECAQGACISVVTPSRHLVTIPARKRAGLRSTDYSFAHFIEPGRYLWWLDMRVPNALVLL